MNTSATADHRPIIVIIDDDESVRRAIVDLVTDCLGKTTLVNIVLAKNGQEGLELIRAGPTPLIVITDLNMPGLDGREVVESLRIKYSHRDLPIVLMTGNCYQVTFSGYTHLLDKANDIGLLGLLVKYYFAQAEREKPNGQS